ncbi:MAG: hypothetical protein IT198_14755 [Acidimicrobiia bacterium]|nr:hypothetical protein [Acidimicrobiia bacterium]
MSQQSQPRRGGEAPLRHTSGAPHNPVPPVLVSLAYAHPAVPADARAPLAISESELAAAYGQLAACDNLVVPDELVIVSTCLRHEVIAVGVRRDTLEQAVKIASGVVDLPDGGEFRYGRAVVDHIFNVAAGLHSPVVGEAEVLGQVRRAHTAARKAGRLGPMLDHLLREAIRTGREARELIPDADTGSIAALAADQLLDRRPGRLAIVGAGRMANAVCARVEEVPGWDMVRITRRPERVPEGALGFDALEDELVKADVAVTAVTSHEPLLTHDLLGRVRERRDSKLLLVDVGMPANVEHTDLAGFEYLGLDDLAEDHRHSRSVDEARALIDVRAYEVHARILNSALTPMILELRRKAERAAGEELERALGRLGDVDARQHAILEQMARTLTNRLLHDPLEYLSSHPEAVSQSKTARDILGIGQCPYDPTSLEQSD